MRKAQNNDTIDVTLFLVHETERAYLVTEDDPFGGVSAQQAWMWIPKSQCERGEKRGAALYEFTMPEWLAIEKGFV